GRNGTGDGGKLRSDQPHSPAPGGLEPIGAARPQPSGWCTLHPGPDRTTTNHHREEITMFRSLFRAATRGRGYPGPRPSRHFTPSLEQLDDRIVPAILMAFDAINGMVTITEDPANRGADNVLVTASATGDIQVNGVTVTDGVTNANVANTRMISVSGGDGDDTLDLSGL